MRKVAIITGITGQDGSYLSELLLKKDYHVVGLVRRSSVNTYERIKHIENDKNLMIVESDLTDPSSINFLVNRYKPDEIYNLAAQSHVATSFTQPITTFQINTVGVLNLLEAVRNFSPHTKFYQASTSEMFGSNYTVDVESIASSKIVHFQDEDTGFSPNSPYAIAKLAAHQMVGVYRKSYGLHASCGILFNHESERRGELFVTKKITNYVAKLHQYKKSISGLDASVQNKMYPKLKLGNLDASRDWGYAPDYVEAMWLMLQQDVPDDYVIATGETRSVKDFVVAAFKCIAVNNWEKYVEIDPEFYRPCEVEFLLGNPQKARTKLGWEPKTKFADLVKKMVTNNEKL